MWFRLVISYVMSYGIGTRKQIIAVLSSYSRNLVRFLVQTIVLDVDYPKYGFEILSDGSNFLEKISRLISGSMILNF